MKKVKMDRPKWGWIFYDFANSAYPTSMITAIFSVYFVKVLVPRGGVVWGSFTIPGPALWSYVVVFTMILVLILAPTLGALADHKNIKNRSLFFWTLVGGLSCAALFTARPGHLNWAIFLTVVSFLAYEMAVVFYNAFLKDVARPSETGRISGLGFSMGYFGGGLCLTLNLFMISNPGLFGLDSGDPTFPIRACFLTVGVWWILFSGPTLFWVRDKNPSKEYALFSYETGVILRGVFSQLAATVRKIRSIPKLSLFLIAYLLYSDGIQTLFIMAGIFGAQEIGMSSQSIILCILVVQFVAFIGAAVFGRLADNWSHKKVVLTTLVVYSLISIWAVFMKSPTEFWIMGIIIGFILGGSQAASRSLYSLKIPADSSSELFSFYAVVGRASAILGPLIFGLISHAFSLRAGVGSLVIFFIVGGLLLSRVDEPKN